MPTEPTDTSEPAAPASDEAQVRIGDPKALKALAHPMRQRLLKLIGQLGPSTVSGLAERIDADPGLVSYHLRELAKRGFVTEVPELARNRRERWWKAAQAGFSFATSDFPTPEGRALAEVVVAQTVAGQFEAVRQYQQTAAERWSQDWRDAATNSTHNLHLTPAELRELVSQLNEVIKPWSDKSRATRGQSSDDDGREHVMLFYHAFPESI
jgi:DNA-binding transcriptional ArsR family regulator